MFPDIVRPSKIPSGFETPQPTASTGFGDIRRPGVSRRPKFPPRTLPANQGGDTLEGDKNKDKDLISLIPIDRTSNKPSKDTNRNDDKSNNDDDPRVLTGGPFIPNFGGGGRPGRPGGPIKDNRIPKDKNTGRGSATLQKVT